MLIFRDKTYDVVKKFVLVLIPSSSFLYFGFSQLFDLPSVVLVLGTLAFISTILGLLLDFSSTMYKKSDSAYDGQLLVTTPLDGQKHLSLQLDAYLEELEQKESITFKVNHQDVLVEEGL